MLSCAGLRSCQLQDSAYAFRVFNWAASVGIGSIAVVIWLNVEYPPPSVQAQQVCCHSLTTAVPYCNVAMLLFMLQYHDRMPDVLSLRIPHHAGCHAHSTAHECIST